MWVGGTLYNLKAWSARYHKDILVEIKKKDTRARQPLSELALVKLC